MPTPNIISKILGKHHARSGSGWQRGFWVWRHDSGIVYVGWQAVGSDPDPLTREATLERLRDYRKLILTGPYYVDLDEERLELSVWDRLIAPDGTAYRGLVKGSPGVATK